MEQQLTTEDVVSLWCSLHDGDLVSLASDRLARSMTLVVEVRYLWEFHRLPEGTRFGIHLSQVESAVALEYVPGPADLIRPVGLSSTESEAVREGRAGRGRRESTSWSALERKLAATEDYEISNGTLSTSTERNVTLTLEMMNSRDHDYPELTITATAIQFFMGGNRELSLAQFVELGETYWRGL